MDTQSARTGPESSTVDQTKEKAQEAVGQAKEKAGGQVRTQVDQRSTEAGQRVGGFASDVRSVGEQLRKDGKDSPAKLADQAAERAERLSDYLTHSDADRILGDVEDFGRRQPWAVVAGGLMLGLAASRFLKASSSRRYEERSQVQRRVPARTPMRAYDTPASYGDTPATYGGAVDVGATEPVGVRGTFVPGLDTDR
jgi:hypothetical protein